MRNHHTFAAALFELIALGDAFVGGKAWERGDWSFAMLSVLLAMLAAAMAFFLHGRGKTMIDTMQPKEQKMEDGKEKCGISNDDRTMIVWAGMARFKMNDASVDELAIKALRAARELQRADYLPGDGLDLDREALDRLVGLADEIRAEMERCRVVDDEENR